MKLEVYEQLVRAGATRRDILKGGAGAVAPAALSSTILGGLTRRASAQDNVRAEILKIPGVGKGSPTDADWQKVGEMREKREKFRRRAHFLPARRPSKPARPVLEKS